MAALLCAASFALCSTAPNNSSIHFGFSAIGSYIGIWNLDTKVYVKNETEADTSNREITSTYTKQWLTDGHDLHGAGGSIGFSGLKDATNWLQLHVDLFLSLRYRFVDATEHHDNVTTVYRDSKIIKEEKDKGSKGKYDISLKYWHIDIPVNMRFLLPDNYFIETGVLLSYIIAANLKIKLISLDFDSYAAGMELGLTGGFGKNIVFQNGQSLDIFSRFVFGVTPLLSDRVKKYLYDPIKPREWLVQAGVSFYLF